VPWAALGISIVALVFSLLAWIDRGGSAEPPATAPSSESAAAAFSAPGAPVDLSSMTPRQAADRLFNRIMAASERGDRVEAMQFVPMALRAYDGVGTLDNDARYHVALIHLVAGDTAKARAQIDSLRKSVPGHLLASMLEYQIAERAGNEGAAVRAYKAFLAAYDTEIAAGRTEYQDHQGAIDRFRQAALANTAGKK
jgi:predicted Zn-dependent protease